MILWKESISTVKFLSPSVRRPTRQPVRQTLRLSICLSACSKQARTHSTDFRKIWHYSQNNITLSVQNNYIYIEKRKKVRIK
jgi:hypothetical protein